MALYRVYRSILIILFLSYGVKLAYENFYVPLDVPKIPEKNYWRLGEKKPDDETIRPFKINIPDTVLTDLRQRLKLDLARLPPSMEGTNFEYGFHSDKLREVVNFWLSDEYKWREREASLNTLPQFKTQISGLDVHFIHAKPNASTLSASVKVLPLLLLHGWPGSIKEFYKLIPYLTTVDKQIDYVFEVISPSLPGFAFSEASHKPGLSPAHIAAMFRQLMLRLGHSKFYVQGGDWGAIIGGDLSSLYPDNVLGLHSTMCSVSSPLAHLYLMTSSFYPSLFMDQDIADSLFPLSGFFSNLVLESGYMHIQATKPDTVGVALSNSPAGLAAYILEKFSTWTIPAHRGLRDGGLTRKFSLPDLLDNVMLYWTTGSITSSMRIYAECFNKEYQVQQWDKVAVKVPTMCVQFPHELFRMPDFILRLKYKQLVPDSLPPLTNPLYLALRPLRGGHFAAFEEPELLALSVFKGVGIFREAASRQLPT